MQYTIIEASHRDSFVELINDHLEMGWVLHGQTSVSGSWYSQAMTRCRINPKKK